MNRRHLLKRFGLSLSVVGVSAGCLGQGDDVQDSDGDGVIDSEDYAPNDPNVQEKADVASSSTATATDTPTTTPTATDTPTPRDTPTATDRPTATPTETPDFRTRHNTTEIVPGPGYYQVSFGFPGTFIVNWSVKNERSSEYDFDVFLMSEAEFQVYLEYINDESDHRPQVYSDGSAQGVTREAARTATLDSGDYHLVVDNTDLGDAGDIGSEAAREVQIQIETRRA